LNENMTDNWNKKKWLKAAPHIGTYIQLSDWAVGEILARAGFKFLVLDGEHGPLSVASIKSQILAIQAANLVCVVRVQSNDPQLIMAPLDLKAFGVQVPNVNTADEAERAVRASRYHPMGMRGSNPYVRANDYGAGEFKEYMNWSNQQSLLVIQVEGMEGLDNFPHILEVPGVDVVWLGPYDLSQSMGIPGEVNHPRVTEKMKQIISLCREKDIAVGTFADKPEMVRKWISLGVDLIAMSFDTKLLYEGAKRLLNEI
jgi:4-hydroxy-2-oxoheptanedioate aldolase